MRTPLAPLALVLVAAPLLLGLSACSSADSDSSGGASGEKETATFQDWQLEFARCMRDAGHEYADPKADGTQNFSLGEGETADSLMADSTTCTKTVEKKLGKRPVAEKDEQAKRDREAQDDCLRKEGVDVPTTGAVDLSGVPASTLTKCDIAPPPEGFNSAG
ncbi:hypothetical protein [Frondihabitans sp. Leaf304]|uniref:hypothetical protein n=1 Tax=Frondihabitans sp. Leaf304 TaxID=1736329 RepID=UPI0006FE3DBE|nr:hypothetical protein [Frondihabitans sp. Leaf304]KQQ26817.1 hypothetical protein ASF54_12755 [Frondihabitans sp. Leaf304]